MRTRFATPLIIAIAASLLAAGCGGGDDDPGSEVRKVDRSGYFTKKQSESINPLLGAYHTASRKLDTNHDACSRTMTRLFDAGRDGKVAVKCHLDNTAGVIAALDQVDAALGEIDGSDFRKACTTRLAETKTFVSDYRDSWKAVQSDWQGYADGKAVSEAATQRHFNDAYAMGSEFIETVIPDLSKDCYTKADREVGADATKDANAA